MRISTPLALIASCLATSCVADVNQYHWTSDGINAITPGFSLLSAYDPNVKFMFYTNGDIGIQISGRSVLGRLPLTDGKIDPTQAAPQLELTSTGHLLLDDGNGNILSELTNITANSAFFGTVNAPFSVTVDYDRRVRLRNSDNVQDIMWTYPPPRSQVDPLDTDEIAFLGVREKLASPSGEWWIMVQDNGVITTNSGYKFNFATQVKVVPPRVLILHTDGSLVFYDCKGVVHPISGFPGPQPGDAASYVLEITDDGLIEIINTVTGAQTWSFQIPATPTKPVSTTTTPTPTVTPTPTLSSGIYQVADITDTKCLSSGSSLIEPCVTNGNKTQEWEIINGALTSAANSDLCLDAMSLTIMKCTDSLRANGNCLTLVSNGGASGLSLSSCNKSATQVWTISGSIPSISGTFSPIYFLGGGRCLSAPSATSGALLSINTCTGSNLQYWNPYVDGTIRLQANNFFCVDVQGGLAAGNRLALSPCNPSLSSQQWSYNSNTYAFSSLGYSIDVADGRNEEGRIVRAWATNGMLAQSWQIGGTYQQMNLADMKSIFDSFHPSLALFANQTSVKLIPFTGDSTFRYAFDNGLLRVAINPALCLTYATNQPRGTKIFVSPCYATVNGVTSRMVVKWDVRSDGTFRDLDKGLCLNDAGNGHNAGDSIIAWDCIDFDGGSRWIWSVAQPAPAGVAIGLAYGGVNTIHENEGVYSPSQQKAWVLKPQGWLMDVGGKGGFGPSNSDGLLVPSGFTSHPYRLTLEPDCNLVIYSANGETVWQTSTFTAGHNKCRLDVSDATGSMVFSNPDGSIITTLG